MTNWTYDTGTFVSPTGERFDIDTEHGRGRMLARLDGMEGVRQRADKAWDAHAFTPSELTQAMYNLGSAMDKLEKLEAK